MSSISRSGYILLRHFLFFIKVYRKEYKMIEIKEVNKFYGQNQVLTDINLKINDGEIFGIIGHSGAGKSTILRCINRLESFDSGSIYVNGQDVANLDEKSLRNLRKDLGMIFQHFSLLERKTVFENVALPMECFKYSKEEIKTRVEELLDLVGILDKKDVKPRNLSGGQKQRVAIARALTMNPSVLLCDEATSALDPKTTEQILELLKKINREMGVTIILITHQMSVIEAICDEVAIIDHSRIAEAGPVKEVFRSPKSEIGRKLILGEGEKEIQFGTGKRIRLVFDGRSAHEPVLSEMILSAKAPVNILFANTKDVDNIAMGQMIIELPENPEDEFQILSFLKERGILYEEVHS